MKLENNKCELDDSKEIITIDYYDRINHKWIKLETTKEVARLLKADDQKTRRKQNQYNYHNLPFDEVFDETKKSFSKTEKYLADESSEIDLEKDDDEFMTMIKNENQRTLVENSLCYLTPEQRECVELSFYKNLSYREIGQILNISKPAVYARIKNAVKNIKKHIKTTQN